MLTELFIRDFAIIDRLRLEFGKGMTVLTGETGAGKSILLDALKLATGERADTSMVAHERDRAEVVARFEIGPAARRQLDDLDLDDESELILRRVVTADGRSRAYINDTPCPVGRLREIGEELIEIHGQHEHYRLLKPEHQLQLVDQAGRHGERLARLRDVYREWKQRTAELSQLRSDASLSDAERDLIAFQVEELEPWIEDAERVEEIHEQHRKLASAQELLETCATAVSELDGDVEQALARIAQRLQRAAAIDEELLESRQLIEAALIQCQEASRALNRYQQGFDAEDADPEDLDRRLSRLHDLARKHRVEPEALPEHYRDLEQRLQRAADVQGEESRLEKAVKDASEQYAALALALSEERRSAAEKLSGRVTGLMKELGMDEGRFEVRVSHDAQAPFSSRGRDHIEFAVTTNAGQPLRPLSKVASGGELSRIGLALKVALSDDTDRLTLIFDEVDSGVGGAVAEIVGDRLRSLSQGRQVFCVTHLPQVASRGHHQYRVLKESRDGRTVTAVQALDETQRVDEIARMLGGREITDRTKAHAEEMLKTA